MAIFKTSTALTTIPDQQGLMERYNAFAATTDGALPLGCIPLFHNGNRNVWWIRGGQVDLTGIHVVVNPDGARHGWTWWSNKKVERQWLVPFQDQPPARETLPCRDPATWTEAESFNPGQKKDPIQWAVYLEMVALENGTHFMWISQSQSGLREWRTFLGIFVRTMGQKILAPRTELPIVELSGESFPAKGGQIKFAPRLLVHKWEKIEKIEALIANGGREPEAVEIIPPQAQQTPKSAKPAMKPKGGADPFDDGDDLPF
jgi:hypothetical protein